MRENYFIQEILLELTRNCCRICTFQHLMSTSTTLIYKHEYPIKVQNDDPEILGVVKHNATYR